MSIRRFNRINVLTTLAIVATAAGPAASLAGPGCMGSNSPMARGFQPYGGAMPYGPGMGGFYGMTPRYGMAPVYPQRVQAAGGYPMRPAQPMTQTSRGSEAETAGAGEDSGDVSGDTVTVRINGMRFEPANINIKPGTTVTWVHSSPMPHTVTGTGGKLRSSTLNNGQSFTHTFDDAGRFDYVCEYHPSMRGTVTVDAG
jgi:plastocyanin